MDIGRKLKDLRVMKGLTQEELADRAELTKGFISQLERNLTSPSIATLMDILQCLGTNIGDFFNEETEEQVVFSKGDYFEKFDGGLKNKIQWIIPNAQKNVMEPILLTLEPGGSTYPDNPPMKGRSLDMCLKGLPGCISETVFIKNKKRRIFLLSAGETALSGIPAWGDGALGEFPCQVFNI